MYATCVELFEEDRPILAMVHNLLLNNATFAACNSTKLNQTSIWPKIQIVWDKFTKTIENEEWMQESEICEYLFLLIFKIWSFNFSLFKNKLNLLFCQIKQEEKCESKLMSIIYAFWFLYAEALNNTILEE